MKFRSAFFLPAALLVLAPAAGLLLAQTPTEAKIKLMAEALTARDAGDFAGAKRKLEALQALAPNDQGVRRLLAEVAAKQAVADAALAAPQQAAASAPPAAPEPAPVTTMEIAPVARATPNRSDAAAIPTRSAAAPEAVMQVPVITEGKPPPPPASNLPEGYAAALAKVEAEGVAFARAGDADRLERLMSFVQAQRALARLYARDGNYLAAMSTLDSAMASLKTSVSDLKSEREEYAHQDALAKEGVRLRHKR